MGSLKVCEFNRWLRFLAECLFTVFVCSLSVCALIRCMCLFCEFFEFVERYSCRFVPVEVFVKLCSWSLIAGCAVFWVCEFVRWLLWVCSLYVSVAGSTLVDLHFCGATLLWSYALVSYALVSYALVSYALVHILVRWVLSICSLYMCVVWVCDLFVCVCSLSVYEFDRCIYLFSKCF